MSTCLIDKKKRYKCNKYQCIQIKWNSMISEKYGIANGVKQGGVLSPILFGIYMDNLIKRLKDSNIGCKIGSNYV